MWTNSSQVDLNKEISSHSPGFSISFFVEDVRNNSAWNQRYFVINQTTDYTGEVLDQEIVFALLKIDEDIYNESPWNYLRGVTQNLDEVYKHQIKEPFNKTVLEHVRFLLSEERVPKVKQLSPFLCMFAMDCFEELFESDKISPEQKCNVFRDEVSPILHKLQFKDDIVRKNYWKFLRLKLVNRFHFE